jgi:hypothetical protein
MRSNPAPASRRFALVARERWRLFTDPAAVGPLDLLQVPGR